MEFLALFIFAIAFILIVFEPFDKSITALLGALLMVIFGILTPEQAIEAVSFETILLLLGMMMLVHMASKSGVLSWINVKMITVTKGNTLAIFFLFSLITAVMSAFLDNVSTVIIMVPLTIHILRGMGKDPKVFIFSEILFSNLGGGLTLIGDPSNIIIGGATKLGFLDFIQNLWIPIFGVMTAYLVLILFFHKKQIKPNRGDLADLHLTFLLIKKIQRRFFKVCMNKWFVAKATTALVLTIIGFFVVEILHQAIPTMHHIPPFVVAILGALLLAMTVCRQVNIHQSFEKVEWSTLFFFAGLFVMVEGVKTTGVLDMLSSWIAGSTTDLFILSILVLWVSGFVSMVLDNIPFVTVMIPVIMGIQEKMHDSLNIPLDDLTILWWALSMGACLGGSGTLVGASANVVSADLARKEGVPISFLTYTKFAFPLTMVALSICSAYLYFAIR